MMDIIWAAMLALACIAAVLFGRADALTNAVTQGAQQAVSLCLSIAGIMGLWSGVLELMQESGLCARIERLLHPLLTVLFPTAKHETMQKIAANVTANLLGLGNAATPIGLQAAQGLHDMYRDEETPHELFRFIILNTTSIQLIPTTVAAVRASLGAQQPFDIVPAVWGASICSAAAGIGAAFLFSGQWRKHR